MGNISCFSAYTTGEKHKATGKKCQDAAMHYDDIEKGISIVVLSDGHGSNRYFRSHIGAQLVTEITLKSVNDFVQKIDERLFDRTYCAMPARTTIAKNELNIKATPVDSHIRQLFASIISQWNEAIHKDWQDHKPVIEELEASKVEPAYISSFLADKEIEIAYGCTLLAIARTSRYWFGFQLGDGKCVAFDNVGQWNEPIPWDERCNGNITTSMCEDNSLDSFRYAFGNKFYPVIFIGSDGMDGAYGNDAELAIQNLSLLYSGIIKSFAKNGFEKALEDIHDVLPRLSAKGISQDDISLGGIIEMDALKEMYPVLLEMELEQAQIKHKSIAKETDLKQKELIKLETTVNKKKDDFNKLKDKINAAKAEKEKHEQIWERYFKEREKALQKWEELQAAIEKLEKEINHLGEDLNFSKNSLLRILKEEQDADKKMKELEQEVVEAEKDKSNLSPPTPI